MRVASERPPNSAVWAAASVAVRNVRDGSVVLRSGTMVHLLAALALVVIPLAPAPGACVATAAPLL